MCCFLFKNFVAFIVIVFFPLLLNILTLLHLSFVWARIVMNFAEFSIRIFSLLHILETFFILKEHLQVSLALYLVLLFYEI